MKIITDFISMWVRFGSPQHVDNRAFEAAGFKTHSAGLLVISPDGLPAEVLARLPADRPVLVGVNWIAGGPVVAVGYPGIYAAGQAMFTAAHLTKDGGIYELFGAARDKSRA